MHNLFDKGSRSIRVLLWESFVSTYSNNSACLLRFDINSTQYVNSLLSLGILQHKTLNYTSTERMKHSKYNRMFMHNKMVIVSVLNKFLHYCSKKHIVNQILALNNPIHIDSRQTVS